PTARARDQVTRSASAAPLMSCQARWTLVMQRFNVTASFIQTSGFEITNTPGTSSTDRSGGSGIYLSGSNVEFSNNYIHNSTAAGIFFTSSASNPVRAHRGISGSGCEEDACGRRIVDVVIREFNVTSGQI